MAVCAKSDNQGRLTIVNTAIADCTSYVVLDSMDWIGSSIWALPTQQDAGLAFSAGFCLPVICFLFAAGCRQVIDMFNSR